MVLGTGLSTDITIDFGSSYGIWVKHTGVGWDQLHTLTSESIILADLDSDGIDDPVIDFGPSYGIWAKYSGDNEWHQIDTRSP